jgi:glycosyltransferase involved in cell wall biosynthesis
VKRADHVITISEFSRREIIKHLHVDGGEGHGYSSRGRENGSEPAGREMPRGIPTPYIMAFSSLSAHKNLPRLVAAFRQIANLVPHSLCSLANLPENPEFRAELEGTGSDRVRFTGYLPDDDVNALMQNASLFAFPSLYEGFGLPILTHSTLVCP